jgi:branched-chain amino acid transport system substrate-binding protein
LNLRRLLLAALVLSTTAVACSGSSPKVTIGALYPRSGTQGTGGTQELHGVELAAQWANAHGGLHGHRIQLVTTDASRAEAVPAAMQALVARGATVVVGSHGSAISAAAAAVASQDKVSFWETGAVGQVDQGSPVGRNFFRLAPMGANLGQAAVSFVRDELAGKLPRRPVRYGVAYVNDAYGRAVGQGAIDEVNRSGLTLAGTFPYDGMVKDFSGIAGQVAATKADVLFAAAYLDDGIALRQALVAAKVPLLAGIGTSSSFCMPDFGARLGPDAVGLFASDKPDDAVLRPSALLPEGRSTLAWASKNYKARWHQEMSAAALSGFANAYGLFTHVLPAARDLRPASVATAALAVKLPEGSLANGGGIDLAPPGAPDAGANHRSAGVIEEWVAPKTREVVWPPAFATHPVVALPLS